MDTVFRPLHERAGRAAEGIRVGNMSIPGIFFAADIVLVQESVEDMAESI